MFGFNTMQAQAILDNQQAIKASVHALAALLERTVQEKPINLEAAINLTTGIQKEMDKVDVRIKAVFS